MGGARPTCQFISYCPNYPSPFCVCQVKAAESVRCIELRVENGVVQWHNTCYTPAKLKREGFKVFDTATISCVYHPPKDEVLGPWYELTHVYVPKSACPALEPAHNALLAVADKRFEADSDADYAAGSRKLKLLNLSSSGGVRGEITDVAKAGGRGNKVQGGRMCMYGAHMMEVGRGTSVTVPGRAKAWATHYNPSGARADVDDDSVMGDARHDAMQLVAAHAGALERLETALLPGAGAARRAIANGCDPDEEYRVASKDAEGEPSKSTGMSLSLTHGCAGHTPCPHLPHRRAPPAFPTDRRAHHPTPGTSSACTTTAALR